VSRVLPFVRTVLPAVAGTAGLTYRRFLPASLPGGVVWASLWVGAGASVAASGILGHPVWLAAVAVAAVLLALVVRVVRRRLSADESEPCRVRRLGRPSLDPGASASGISLRVDHETAA
jgi:membrane protein DedA with SNARE-associated domain